jgi:hypothetical protein
VTGVRAAPGTARGMAAAAGMVKLKTPGPCRVCGLAAYLGDEQSPVHPCCLNSPAGRPCPACAASRAASPENHYSKKARAREGRP